MRSMNKSKRREPRLSNSGRAAVGRARFWIRRLPGRATAVTVLCAGLMTGFGGAGWYMVKSGGAERMMSAAETAVMDATRVGGLEVRHVLVVGRDRTERSELLQATGITTGDPILGIDLGRVHSRVASLAWVKQARIERRLPDTVFVSLVERQPMALWQRDGKLHVIDVDGGVIPDRDVGQFGHLPIVIGEDAPARAHAMLAMLAGEPDLGQRVRAVTWVGERRWDVRVDDRINVQLPEQDPRGAWAQLAKMEREHGVLRRDVVTIDMRLRDQLVVRVAPEAAARKRDRGRDT